VKNKNNKNVDGGEKRELRGMSIIIIIIIITVKTVVVHIRFWWGDLRERDHLEDLGVDVRIILKLIFTKWHGKAWTALIWLRIGKGDGLL
jgi:hypothetical protein